MDSSLIQLGHFRLRCHRRRLTKRTLVLVKKRLRRQREGLIVATNATLFLHTSLFPPSDLELAKMKLERVKLKFNALEFNFAQSHVRENKSAEIFPQHYTSSFGEIFPWRKFPAIRYKLPTTCRYTCPHTMLQTCKQFTACPESQM